MLLITSDADVRQALAFINSNEVLAYDIESTGLNVRKDSIIGFGVSNGTTGFYCPIFSFNVATDSLEATSVSAEQVQQILAALVGKKLLTWNGSFDARFTFYNLGVNLVPSLYADIMLMKHTTDENFPFGLKDCAAKVFGSDAKAEQAAMKASIKANGGSANEFFKADTDLMAKYCVQDCALTFRLWEHYSRELRAQGLEAFYYDDEVMPLYREVTIPMEMQGVAVDVPLMQSTLAEICDDLQTLEAEVQSEIEPLLSVFQLWFLNKDYPLKTHTGRSPVWTKKHSSQLDAWRADVGDTANMFNLQSRYHLAKLFFDTLGEEPLTKTPTGKGQIDEDFLDAMAPKYPWAHKLVQFNKLTKLKGTYIERILEESEDGRFYASYKQHGTISGRYSGDMQQLPRPIDGDAGGLVSKYTGRIRQFIVPSSDCQLMSADYESLEPHIFAHTSGDAALQDIFNRGDDFYSTIAIATEGLQGVSASKDAPNYLGKVNKGARQKSKTYSLGIPYGMTAFRLKHEINVSAAEAETLVSNYLSRYADLAKWMQNSKAEVLRTGTIKTQSGRIRHMPQAVRLYRQYGNDILDDLALWKRFSGQDAAYKKAKEDRKTLKNLLNNAINFQVQGLAASIVSRASIEVNRRLKAGGYKAAMCMSVHDELVLDVPEHECKAVGELVQDVMQTIVKLAVPLRTTPQFGTTYRDCK